MAWAPLGWHVVARRNRAAIGHIGFDRFSLMVNGRATSVIGIGGVVVRPEFQKQGIPARMFEAVHAEAPTMLDARVFTLFCPQRLVPYYRRHGYDDVAEVPGTPFRFMARGGAFPRNASLTFPPVLW